MPRALSTSESPSLSTGSTRALRTRITRLGRAAILQKNVRDVQFVCWVYNLVEPALLLTPKPLTPNRRYSYSQLRTREEREGDESFCITLCVRR